MPAMGLACLTLTVHYYLVLVSSCFLLLLYFLPYSSVPGNTANSYGHAPRLAMARALLLVRCCWTGHTGTPP